MARLVYRAAIPLGPTGLFTLVVALIDPVVVLKVKAPMVFELLFDTKRNLPLECIANATGCDPWLGRLDGAVNAPVVVLIWYPKT